MTDWNEIWASVGVLTVLLFVAFLGILAFAPKNVDYYYLTTANTQHSTTCVDAHWTWHTDEVAFCTDDKDKALDFVTRANASLKH